MIFKHLLQGASPEGVRGRLSILAFHRVLASPDALFPNEVDTVRFDAICGWLSDWFNVLPLDKAVAALSDGTLPARALCITFDDGYADNHDIALPILKRHGLHATFFIATGFLNGGRMWNDTIIESLRGVAPGTFALEDLRPLGIGPVCLDGVESRRIVIETILSRTKYLPIARRAEIAERIARLCKARLTERLMMTPGQVQGLSRAGMGVGAHTVNHPILATESSYAALREIEQSKATLESLLDDPVSLFAYPNGVPGEDYGLEHVQMVEKLGFDAAVSTVWGAARSGSNLFELPRFTPWDRGRARFGFRLLWNLRSR